MGIEARKEEFIVCLDKIFQLLSGHSNTWKKFCFLQNIFIEADKYYASQYCHKNKWKFKYIIFIFNRKSFMIFKEATKPTFADCLNRICLPLLCNHNSSSSFWHAKYFTQLQKHWKHLLLSNSWRYLKQVYLKISSHREKILNRRDYPKTYLFLIQ